MNISATAYGDHFPGYPLAAIPAQWWLKIELTYPDRTAVLVYEEPADETELRNLTRVLQQASAAIGFTVTVVQPDGERLSDAMAELMARYPITPERAASNARLLDEEVAAHEAAHPEHAECPETTRPAA